VAGVGRQARRHMRRTSLSCPISASCIVWGLALGGSAGVACAATHPDSTRARTGAPEPRSADAGAARESVEVADAARDSDSANSDSSKQSPGTYGDESAVYVTTEIKFRARSSEIDADQEETLRRAHEIMTKSLSQHPEYVFEIRGYADSFEGERSESLSTERARAVEKRLIQMGIAEDRLRLTASVLKMPNSASITEENRSQIRRVSIRVVNPAP
jgi:outer membrane protein OmpA-like peptidoglycan-associated protein